MTFEEWWNNSNNRFELQVIDEDWERDKELARLAWEAGCEEGFQNGLDAASMQDAINKTRGLD